MTEENSNTMNFDLNLGPLETSSDDDTVLLRGSYPNIAMSVADWLDNSSVEFRELAPRRSFRLSPIWTSQPISPEMQTLSLELIGGNEPQTGEGSVAPPTEVVKICENGTGYTEDEGLGTKKECGKNSGEEGGFFDCNICLELAKDPVVTCCGHLFCWPCLYRWLHHHSDAKECPVCKGEVTMKDVTPIYGRGRDKREPDLDTSLKIPHRPQARRIQGWRQTIQRASFNIPMEEMIQRLGNTYDLTQQITHGRTSDGSPEIRIPQSRSRIRGNRSRDQAHPVLTPAVPGGDDLNDSGGGTYREAEATPAVASIQAISMAEINHRAYEARENHNRLRSVLLRRRRPHPHRAAASLSHYPNFYRSVEGYLHNNNPAERNQEPDRDSVSSIAAVIHSESQTIDNAVEIDSTVARSTLSSRRSDASRVSDVDTGDSRSNRRRRLN